MQGAGVAGTPRCLALDRVSHSLHRYSQTRSIQLRRKLEGRVLYLPSNPLRKFSAFIFLKCCLKNSPAHAAERKLTTSLGELRL
jgi:hypothetical protein